MTKRRRDQDNNWAECTFEAAERRTLSLGLQSTLLKKIQWLEEAETLALQFRASREKSKKKTR